MGTNEVYNFMPEGPVSIEQANKIAMLLQKITAKYVKLVGDYNLKLSALSLKESQQYKTIAQKKDEASKEWETKVRKLGGIPTGEFFVDINAGDGYYCWKYPETQIYYWHDYKSSKRMLITEKNAERELT